MWVGEGGGGGRGGKGGSERERMMGVGGWKGPVRVVSSVLLQGVS